jgi:hypothetical protein
MYAAMPAILRDAIEQTYEDVGWDLIRSVNYLHSDTPQADDAFPTFSDLLNRLPKVVESSQYSKDTGSDYKGALVTRVKSLTKGIHGQIFSGDTRDADLFDKNVIVDLSRIGSQETKALIMGVLVLRLQEYRIATHNSGNEGLKHITVLEEAHNLLRRTSSEQTQESSNLQGKSVEMLANAIAEMRTYGEAFVIADQSPGLMDMSVVRNTNTKIVLRLPDQGDRELVGKAMGLNENQIGELSRLETGVAAVFQNNWLEAVLCKVDKFDDKKYGGYNPPEHSDDVPSAGIEKLLEYLADDNSDKPLKLEDVDSVRNWVKELGASTKVAHSFDRAVQEGLNGPTKGDLAYNLLKGKRIANIIEANQGPDSADKITQMISGLTSVENNELLNRLFTTVILPTIEQLPEVTDGSELVEKIRLLRGGL